MLSGVLGVDPGVRTFLEHLADRRHAQAPALRDDARESVSLQRPADPSSTEERPKALLKLGALKVHKNPIEAGIDAELSLGFLAREVENGRIFLSRNASRSNVKVFEKP